MAVGTRSDAIAGLAASKATVTRLRLGLEGSRPLKLAGRSSLTPTFEVELRRDSGDAETGAGADVGAGLTWSHPGLGPKVAVHGRTLLTHEDRSFRNGGMSGSLTLDPKPGSEPGPALTLRQSLGAPAKGGVQALLRPETPKALAANDTRGDFTRGVNLKVGYGIPFFGDRPIAVPEAVFGLTRTERNYSLGWRLSPARQGWANFGLSLERTRRDTLNDSRPPEHRIQFRLGLRW